MQNKIQNVTDKTFGVCKKNSTVKEEFRLRVNLAECFVNVC